MGRTVEYSFFDFVDVVNHVGLVVVQLFDLARRRGIGKYRIKLDNRFCFRFITIASLFSFSLLVSSCPGSCQTAGFALPA